MVNAAIVGLGRWGRTLVEAAGGCAERLHITHAVVRHPQAHEAYAGERRLKLVPRLDDVLALPDIDAAILATPHTLHAPQVVAAARAGKHVFCEKPLALTYAEASRAVRECQQAKRVLAVGHDKRFWPAMVALRDIAASGALGQLLHVEGHTSNQNSSAVADWRERPEEAPGGGMTGAGIHVLDALLSIAGPAAEITAQIVSARSGHDPRDTVSALCRFRNGMSGALSTVRVTPFYWRVHVFGDQGSAEALGDTRLVMRTSSDTIEHRYAAMNAATCELIAFADAIASGTPFPIGTAEMLATVAAFEATIQSIERGRSITIE